MAVFRKILLFVVALAIGIGAYLGYKLFTNPPAIDIGGGYKIVKVINPTAELAGAEGNIGDTTIGQTEVSEFNLLDPQGNVKSRFGFKKLVHSEGFEWELEEPYVNMYGKDYVCNVKSDSGFIRIEMVAGKPVPVSARLNENVVIDIETEDGGRDCEITLESLNYDIERNRFESIDTVHLLAKDMEMLGKGMTLIYNAESSRIELLKIPDLDYITITEQQVKNPLPVEDNVEEVAQGEDGSDEKMPEDEKVVSATKKSVDGVLYEFILDDNVNVVTENEKIKAATVRISNILWAGGGNPLQEPQVTVTETPEQEPIENLPKKSDDGFEYWQPDTDAPKESKPAEITPQIPLEYETVTVLHVTCDGGLIFRPLKQQATGDDVERTLDLIGSPVTVESNDFISKSPYLWYGVDSETLRLYSRDQRPVTLTTPDGKASLETEKILFWDQANSLATVKGPGSIYLIDDEKGQATKTKLDFADTIKLKMLEEQLETVKVIGGFTADISGSNVAQISSGRALLFFADESNLRRIELAENVTVSSSEGGVVADSVMIDFVTDETGRPSPQIATATGNAKLIASGGEVDEYSPVMNAGKIEYQFDEQVAVASGNIELDFTIPSPTGGVDMPMTINADRNVVYKAGDGYIEFNDNVRGVTVAEQKMYSEQSIFNCDKLIVYLDKDTLEASESPSFKSLVLEGEKVVLENKRFTADSLISVVNLECSGFDYDTASGIMTALGPGSIKVNNRDVSGKPSDEEVSLDGPCYALIENFSKLTLKTLDNRVIAEGGEQMLHIGYLPILPDGKTGTQRLVDTGRMQIDYIKLPDGKTDISYMTADGKVYYYEPDKYQLIGDNLKYNASTGLVKINGTKSNPCVLNSSLVDFIEYNIKTGSIKTDISGVSSVPGN